MNSADKMERSALLRLQHIDSHAYAGGLLWAAAADLFGLGSTSAIALCRRHDLDPDSRLPESSTSKMAQRCVEIYEDENLTVEEAFRDMLAAIDELSARD